MTYPGILQGDTPEAMREHAIARILVPIADAAFKARADINSVVLAVAQYWNDEADDAVHVEIQYSKRHTPLWPHECGWGEEQRARADFCKYCDERVPGHPQNPGWVPWDDNGSAIPAFEAFCREGCHQEMTTGEAYLPYAIARRQGGVEIVGQAVRPWLDRAEAVDVSPIEGQLAELLAAVYASPFDDGPRAVLADWLLEKGDPIGELIALQLKKNDARELIEAHGRRWIGELNPIVTKSGAVFRRGFLAEAEVYFASKDELDRYASDPSWGTVERIHFLPGSRQRLDPSMRALCTVSGLGREALQEALRSEHRFGIRDLATDVEDRETLRLLEESTAFPELVRFELGGSALRELIDLLRSPFGTRLERIALPADNDQLPMILDSVERFTSVPELEVSRRLDAGRTAGWRLIFERGADRRFSTLRAVLDNLRGDGRIERITEIIERLPRHQLTRVLLARTPVFDPMVEDELALRQACASQQSFQGVELA